VDLKNKHTVMVRAKLAICGESVYFCPRFPLCTFPVQSASKCVCPHWIRCCHFIGYIPLLLLLILILQGSSEGGVLQGRVQDKPEVADGGKDGKDLE